MKYLKSYENYNNKKLQTLLNILKDQPIINDLRKCRRYQYPVQSNSLPAYLLFSQHTDISKLH